MTRIPQSVEPAASHYDAALRAFNTHDFAAAARRCDAVLATAPDHAEALRLRALIHLRLRQFAAAEDCARRALSLAPDRPAFHHTLGYICRLQERLAEAEIHYEDALRVDAGHVDSLAGLGAIQAQQGRLDEAKECYRRAIAMKPDAAALHYNLGRAHEDAGEPADAARCYRRALDLDPGQSHAWLNFGGVMAQLGDMAGAVDAVRRAIALRPDYAAAHNNLGTLLQGEGELDAALASFREAIRLQPAFAEAHRNVGSVLRQLNRPGEAAAALEEALRLEPDHDGARFSLSVVRGENPPHPPGVVVQTLFDGYADRFDEHLEGLDYRIPEQLVAGIATLRKSADTRLDALDLGCGTGLFGAAIGSLARTLTGVDLSPRMLDKARARALYDRLEAADIAAFLRDETAERYDLVAAADVFIYVGALDDVFAHTARVLRPRGLFAFSIEAAPAGEAAGYRLQTSGRYTHDETYLRALANRSGFALRQWSPATIRMQHGTPVAGWIAILEK